MDTTIDQQVAMDEALVPTAQRLKIGRRNFRLLSDIKSKESTLQLVHDVLRICSFFKAFLITADPWRSFAAIINKCLTEKSSGYDSLRLSQAQILWGLYHKRNVDYAYLIWEDFVYQVEHKNQKKSNEMYYPRFTKAIIHHFMSKDLSIPRRNKTIIKEQVKEQVKVQVSKILPRIKQAVNEKLEAEVLTRSSHSSRTSYAVAADHKQRNLYKALVDAYESDKIILDTYGETVTLKRQRDYDADKDEESSAGPDRGSKRRREGKEPESASALMETTTRSAGRVDTLTPELLARPTYNLMKGSCKSLIELEYHLEEVYKATTDQLDWVNPEGQQYPHNLLQPLPLIPNNRGHRVIPFEHFINNDLEYLRGGASSRKYTTSITKIKAADYRRIIAVTELKIVEWHSYKHLDWITVRIDDDKIYKFKEGEDMLLLLVQGKLTNLTVKERFTFNVSLRMFTRSIIIQRRVEDLQLEQGQENRLMRIDALHKFCDRTLTDVRTALDDRLKWIRMR
nr:hypothetical protein [Tanacetum cinerariifolium]